MDDRRALTGLLDTSVFVAAKQGRELGDTPDEGAVSVVTLGELELGVLTAADSDTRSRRVRTLAEVERSYEALPVDGPAIREFARIVAAARKGGRRPRALDALIAATASSLGVPVYTQDADFEDMPGVEVVRV